MKTAGAPGRHLTPDEIVDRVFPADEQPAPVPLHLAACPDCQEKVSQLREAWLLDRGAVGGLVESIPDAFWIAQALLELSPRQRSVFVMKHYEEKTIAEIGFATGLDAGTIKSHLFRAARKLRAKLEDLR